MTQQPVKRPIRRGRIFPNYIIPPDELAKRQAELDTRYQRCRSVFEQTRDKFITDHYNWFMIIEPNSGDYFIDPDEKVADQKARHKYPSGWLVTFRINETGACGQI